MVTVTGTLSHFTPSKQKFLDARRIDGGVLIQYRHRNSDEVWMITQGTKTVLPATGHYCSVHGGFNYTPCTCGYETRIK